MVLRKFSILPRNKAKFHSSREQRWMYISQYFSFCDNLVVSPPALKTQQFNQVVHGLFGSTKF